MIDPSIISFLSVFSQPPHNLSLHCFTFPLIVLKLEKNDVAVPRGSVNLFYEEGIISYPAYFGDDTIREGEFLRPRETLYGGGGKGKGVDGDGGVGCTRFRVPVKVSKVSLREYLKREGKTYFISSSVWY